MSAFPKLEFSVLLFGLSGAFLITGLANAQTDDAKSSTENIEQALSAELPTLPILPPRLSAISDSEQLRLSSPIDAADEFNFEDQGKFDSPNDRKSELPLSRDTKQALEFPKSDSDQSATNFGWVLPTTPIPGKQQLGIEDSVRVAKARITGVVITEPWVANNTDVKKIVNGKTYINPYANPVEESRSDSLPIPPRRLPKIQATRQPNPSAKADLIIEQLRGDQAQSSLAASLLPEVPLTHSPNQMFGVPKSESGNTAPNLQWALPTTPTTGQQTTGDENSFRVAKAIPVKPIGSDLQLVGEIDTSKFPTNIPQANPVPVHNIDSLLWWKNQLMSSAAPGSALRSVETNSLVYYMLQRSPRLRAVSQNPLIQEQRIVEAEASFDPVSFLQSQFQDRVDPVGDSLSVTNDGTNSIDEHIWTANLGLRRKTLTGATVELSQQLGFRNSNLNIFSPQDQGTATLALNVTQPLLRGRGEYINRSQILIAQSTTNASWDTLSIALQDEIQSVVDAYWRLYFDRCVFLQKKMNVERAQQVFEKLEGRTGFDSLPNQIARARSAVRSRTTELANARRDIRNSETDIRRLIADSNWAASQAVELLPIELPELAIPVADLEYVVVTALNNRPEIREAVKRSKVAAIQRDISVNDLLPELSLLLGTYVSALEGESRLGDAFIDQFGSVKPGYSVGIEFELPIRNRVARSRLTQRKLQLNIIKAEIDETVQNVIAESQIARRRVVSAKETLAATAEAIYAARLDMDQNASRWESFALVEGDVVEGLSPTVVLDRLLDSQERLAATELVYAEAEMELMIAEIAMQRTMGTLLTHKAVNFSRGSTDGTPTIGFGSSQ